MRKLILIALAALCLPCLAAPTRVDGVRTWPGPSHTRVVFDLDGPVEYTLFTLYDPERVVLKLRDAVLAVSLSGVTAGDVFLSGMHGAPRHRGDLRVVLALKRAARVRSFLAQPAAGHGYRLVVDLSKPSHGALRPATTAARSARAVPPRDVVVAIDAGHGGADPGATGPGGTREKDVTLAIARQLRTLLRLEPGMRAVMLRDGDYYVGLRRRVAIARAQHADLFVSIHADSFRDPRIGGGSVYILSRNGASSESARRLAEQENAADLPGAASLDDEKQASLTSVLLALTQSATMSASSEFGSCVLRDMRLLGITRKRHVERAGFLVLKSAGIPSILVETGYISNPEEERRLNEPGYQHELAGAILAGIRSYFRRNAPPGTWLAQRRRLIARGDTPSAGTQHDATVGQSRRASWVRGNRLQLRLQPGQVLRLPRPALHSGL